MARSTAAIRTPTTALHSHRHRERQPRRQRHEDVLITVDNLVPTLTISGAATVNEGASYTLNLSSSDPGADTISELDDQLGRRRRRS